MFSFFKKKPLQFDKIESNTFASLMNKENHLLLDVRSPEEIKSGSIPGSISIDFLKIDFKRKLDQLDKSKTYLVYCLYGPRSLKTCKMMMKMGFHKVYHLEDGMIGWYSYQESNNG